MKNYVRVPEILMPKSADLEKWATVACDQFTAEPKYWQTLETLVGDAPSTLKITVPEIYLKENLKKRIENAQITMREYLDGDFFQVIHGLVLVERQCGSETRVGLMVSIDLDAYDWNRVRVPFRATEDTIMARLPVRAEMRKNAPIEVPHILLLIDDDKKEIIEPLYENRDQLKKLYDFDLNMDGGHIRGYSVEDTAAVLEKFGNLLNPTEQIRKYGVDAGVLMAVGDGNHSIAAAKLIWEERKKNLSPEEYETCPARYLLAEAVNLYGGGMEFEPIHRVVFTEDDTFLQQLQAALHGVGKIKVRSEKGAEYLFAPDKASIAIREIQKFLEIYQLAHPETEVDYIHGEGHLKEILEKRKGYGIVMPAFPREELFPYVMNVGNLPKKAFSIGAPEQKRYYLEYKRI